MEELTLEQFYKNLYEKRDKFEEMYAGGGLSFKVTEEKFIKGKWISYEKTIILCSHCHQPVVDNYAWRDVEEELALHQHCSMEMFKNNLS